MSLARDLMIAVRRRGVLFAVCSLATFLIYLRTLAPGVLPGDSGEFQFAAWDWTLVHPTGYPLYLLIGGIWQHLVPFGDPAYRLNLLSAIFSALAVGLTYRVFYRIVRQRGAALVAALTFAVCPIFWSQATESEVYALNSLFVAALVYLALRWQANRDLRYSAAWSLTFGLALTHHRSIILLIPAFAAFFAYSIYERVKAFPAASQRASWLVRDATYALLAALPLLLYAYVPLRGAVTPYALLRVSPAQTIVTFVNTPPGWIAYISGRAFESELVLNEASVRALQELPRLLLAQFNPLGVGLGLLGLGVIFYRRRWSVAALTLFGFVGIVLFNSAYHIGDIHDYYTPALFFFSLWIAAGLGAILKLLGGHPRLHGSLLPVIVLLLVAALLPLENLFNSFADQDQSEDVHWATRWRTILNSDLAPNAILVSNDRDEMTPMWYLQIVEGLRPDLLGLFPLISPDPAYANTVRLISNVIDSGRPLYVIKDMPGLALRFRLDPIPPDLYRVSGESLAPPQYSSGAQVGDQLRIIGYSLVAGAPRPGGEVTLAVYWQPLRTLDRDYSTSLQLLNGAGQKISQGQDHRPGGDTYPTSLWQPAEILQDQFLLNLPSDLDPGVYHLAVRVYGGDETLGDLTQIGPLQITQ